MSSAVSSVHRPSVRAGVLAALLALLLPVLAVSGSSPARASSCNASSGSGTYGGGDGNPGTPHLICSPDHIAHLANRSGDWGKEFLQTADITMPAPSGTPAVNHTPIGDGTEFTGVYDGGGFEIRNLTVDISANGVRVGFFGETSGATLKNIRLVNVSILNSGNSYTGGLAGQMKGGSVSDSFVSGVVVGTSSVGGLVGYASSSAVVITKSSSSATVSGTGDDVGGLVGGGNVQISESSASGGVTGNGVAVGGLVGALSQANAEVVDSFASGSVQGRDGVGGLVGMANNGNNLRIIRSHATGAVEGRDGVGGLVGLSQNAGAAFSLLIEDSFATGSVTGTSSNVGCLIGAEDQNVTRTNAVCRAPSPVFGEVTSTVDGFTVPITNFDPDVTWVAAVSPGSAVIGTDGVLTVTGLDAGATATVTVTTSRTGVSDGTGSVTGSALAASTTPSTPSAPAPAAEPSAAAGPSFVAPGGVVPVVSAGLGEWVQADGSATPLAVSSPGVNQLRYEADGVQVTFTGGAGSDVSRGLVANPAGEIVCEVCVELAAGQVIEVWMFSTPRLVAAHLTEDLPCQRFSVPVVAPLDGGGPVVAGAHTLQLALPTAQGMQAVNVGVTVGGPVPASVPAGDGPAVPVGLVALGLLAAAGGLLAARRQAVAD